VTPVDPLRQDGPDRLAGRYRLRSLLGRGGMGMVWRAHDEQLDREVAVKELRLPELLDDAGRRTWMARLDREARAAARLRHPGIVTVHDWVTGDDGRPWIVMELVHGGSLEDLLKAEGRLPPRRVAQIGLQVLDALHAAHRAGITHRDIKPANVLLEGERVVLTDFGIAAIEGDVSLTGTGAVIGTPAYMSPEQVRGQEVTAASDLWSLGATLYTAVEGRHAFAGPTAGAVLIAVATEDPPPPAHAGPLAPVLAALLHREPSQRPGAELLHTQLTAAAQGRTPEGSGTRYLTTSTATGTKLLTSAVTPVPQPPRPRRKGVRVALLALAAGLALAVAAAVATTVIGGLRTNARYEANMDAVAGLGQIPGETAEVGEAGEGRVRVRSVLCDDAGDPTTAPCQRQALVTSVVSWFQARPGVQSVSFSDPRENCGSKNAEDGCRLLLLTQSPLKITEVSIANEGGTHEGRSYDRLVLTFIVG
jgi:tRNA A-37 threonylcarbamoyl transferase component Bud32